MCGALTSSSSSLSFAFAVNVFFGGAASALLFLVKLKNSHNIMFFLKPILFILKLRYCILKPSQSDTLRVLLTTSSLLSLGSALAGIELH